MEVWFERGVGDDGMDEIERSRRKHSHDACAIGIVTFDYMAQGPLVQFLGKPCYRDCIVFSSGHIVLAILLRGYQTSLIRWASIRLWQVPAGPGPPMVVGLR